MDEFKRNQIPAFGNWDYSDELPITQYFESARQAGLLRYSCGERDLYGAVGDNELLYSDYPHIHHDLRVKPAITVVSRRKTKGGEKRFNQVSSKEQKKQGRVYDLTEPARQQYNYHGSNHQEVVELQVPPSPPPYRAPKAVDEDLYKIPPELLYKQPKRKRVFGFFSCLVPNCAA